MSERPAPTKLEYRDAAREARASDPHLSIDDRPEIIPTMGGAYVAAWVWVPNPHGGLALAEQKEAA